MKKLALTFLLLVPFLAGAATVPWNRPSAGVIDPLYITDGIGVYGSSTIGGGTNSTGLTINGTASTTRLCLVSDCRIVWPVSSSFGQTWELTSNTFGQSALAPTTTQNILVSGIGTSTFAAGLEAWRQIGAPYFQATSSSVSSVFPLAKITKLSNLTSNGFVKTSGGDGTLTIDTNTYLTSIGTFYPFTAGTYNGQTVSATGTPIWDTANPIGIIASSTFTTRATTTDATTTTSYVSNKLTWGSNTGLGLFSSGALTVYGGANCTTQVIEDLDASGAPNCVSVTDSYFSGQLAVGHGGTGLATFGGTNTILYTTSAGNLSSEAAFTYNPTTNNMVLDFGSTTSVTTSQGAWFATSGGNVGIATGTPTAKLAVAGTSLSGAFAVSTTSNTNSQPNFLIDTVGHMVLSGPPPVVSVCGSSPSVTGNDSAGKITTGTGGPTSCTVTFANTFTTAPSCTLSWAPSTNIMPVNWLWSSTTATKLSFMASSTPGVIANATMTSYVVSYHCIKTQ